MSNILIIDGGKTFTHFKGELNYTLTDVAASHLRDLGYQVSVTVADSNYSIEEKVQKYLDRDVVIYQMPGWVDGRTLDGKTLYRRNFYRRSRQALRQR